MNKIILLTFFSISLLGCDKIVKNFMTKPAIPSPVVPNPPNTSENHLVHEAIADKCSENRLMNYSYMLDNIDYIGDFVNENGGVGDYMIFSPILGGTQLDLYACADKILKEKYNKQNYKVALFPEGALDNKSYLENRNGVMLLYKQTYQSDNSYSDELIMDVISGYDAVANERYINFHYYNVGLDGKYNILVDQEKVKFNFNTLKLTTRNVEVHYQGDNKLKIKGAAELGSSAHYTCSKVYFPDYYFAPIPIPDTGTFKQFDELFHFSADEDASEGSLEDLGYLPPVPDYVPDSFFNVVPSTENNLNDDNLDGYEPFFIEENLEQIMDCLGSVSGPA